MIPAMDSALSALDALGKKMDVTANNIANVDTESFKKSRAVLQEEDHGVTVNISRVNTQGCRAFDLPSECGPRHRAPSRTGTSRTSSGGISATGPPR